MRKIIDAILVIVIWSISGLILNYFKPINWDFFIGSMAGYILAMFFYHSKKNEPIKKEVKADTYIESEVDDAPWYK